MNKDFFKNSTNQFYIATIISIVYLPYVSYKIAVMQNSSQIKIINTQDDSSINYTLWVSITVLLIIWFFTLLAFSKMWFEKKSKQQIESLKSSLELLNKSSTLTTRLFNYNILEYLRNKDETFISEFCKRMYNMNISVEQLKENNFDALYINYYKAYISDQEKQTAMNYNDIIKKDFKN